MKRKRLSVFILLACFLSTDMVAKAQEKSSHYIEKAFYILACKVKYEEAISNRSPHTAELLAMYKNAIADIKKDSFGARYIDVALKKDKERLSRSFVRYVYINPLSSYIGKNDFISRAEYLRIFKHSIIEQQATILSQ